MKTRYQKLKNVIFDLDDTLYLERDYVKSGFHAVAAWLAQRLDLDSGQIALELIDIFHEDEKCQAINIWLNRYALDPEKWLPPMLHIYRTHSPSIGLDSGTEQMLKLAAAKYPLGLITDGRSVSQRAKIEALAIGSLFNSIVISDELKPKCQKPHKMPYQKTLENLSCAPSRAIYIADNPLKDFVTPRSLGMATIRVRHPLGLYHDKEPPDEKHASEITVSNISEICPYLDLI